jgi:hypothetical protein
MSKIATSAGQCSQGDTCRAGCALVDDIAGMWSQETFFLGLQHEVNIFNSSNTGEGRRTD